MDNIITILKSVISWPTVFLVVILVFSKQLKRWIDVLLNKDASIKLPGNVELSLKDLKQRSLPSTCQETNVAHDGAADELAQVISRLPEKSPEAIKDAVEKLAEDRRQAELSLYLNTISHQLIAWLYYHNGGSPFGFSDLLSHTRIPISIDNHTIGAYCIHSIYEKEAVASEFYRNYWNFKRLKLIEDVNDKQVRIIQNDITLSVLKDAMKNVYRNDMEIRKIEYFSKKFLNVDGDGAKKAKSPGGNQQV